MKTLKEIQQMDILCHISNLLSQIEDLKEWPVEIKYTSKFDLVHSIFNCREITKGDELSSMLDGLVTKEIYGRGLTRSYILNDIVLAINYFTEQGLFCYKSGQYGRDSFYLYYPFEQSVVFNEIRTPDYYAEAIILEKLALDISFEPMLFKTNSFYIFHSSCNLGVKILL